MHSFKAPSGVTYHHDGDFGSGVEFLTDDVDGRTRIPLADLKALAAEFVRRTWIEWIEQNEGRSGDTVTGAYEDRIEAIERMTDHEVLGLPPVDLKGRMQCVSVDLMGG